MFDFISISFYFKNKQTQFEVVEMATRQRANADASRRHELERARSRPSKREIIYARNLSFYDLFSIFFFAITLETLKIENDWAQFWIFTSNHHSSTCQKLNLNKLA